MYVLNQSIVHVDPYNTEFHFVSVIKRNTYMYICIYIYIWTRRLFNTKFNRRITLPIFIKYFFIAPYVAETSFYEKSSFFTL